MSLPDLGVPEGAETDLNHRPVVQDLGQRIGVGDRILEKENDFDRKSCTQLIEKQQLYVYQMADKQLYACHSLPNSKGPFI